MPAWACSVSVMGAGRRFTHGYIGSCIVVSGKWLAALAAVMVLSGLPVVAGAQIYKWVDANGKVQFGNVPPPSGAEQIKGAASPAEKAPEAAVKPTTEAAPAEPSAFKSADIVGRWYMKNDEETLDWTFKADGSFAGTLVDSMGTGRSAGSWELKGDTLRVVTRNTFKDGFSGNGEREATERSEYTLLGVEAGSLKLLPDQSLFKRPPYTFIKR
ncbi:DUF4124 domain-containing protein [Pseudomonas solani]|uniref:DUF4124 domain-containing protein n=1 Tax=Pseudomonas solani TaxID=2731552 RepID=A0AAU7XYZ6_9PSED